MLEEYKEIYEDRKRNLSEIKNLLEEVEYYKSELNKLQNECNHDIVFNIYDYRPRKIGFVMHYFCPACGKIESVSVINNLKDTSFVNSKIIDLIIEPIEMTEKNLEIIQTKFFENIDCGISDENIKDIIINEINNQESNFVGARVLDKFCK